MTGCLHPLTPRLHHWEGMYLELWATIKPLSLNLLLSEYFYRSNRKINYTVWNSSLEPLRRLLCTQLSEFPLHSNQNFSKAVNLGPPPKCKQVAEHMPGDKSRHPAHGLQRHSARIRYCISIVCLVLTLNTNVRLEDSCLNSQVSQSINFKKLEGSF